MPLKVTLKPRERLILGGAVVRNGESAAHLLVENEVPILRERDILSESHANSPCRRIYFAIQLMYVDERNLAEHHRLYWLLVHDLLEAAPSTSKFTAEINRFVVEGKYYQALKVGRRLIEYEQELLLHT
jgi:flagellar biosynthesis repressor protein FlbT